MMWLVPCYTCLSSATMHYCDANILVARGPEVNKSIQIRTPISAQVMTSIADVFMVDEAVTLDFPTMSAIAESGHTYVSSC